MMMIVRKMKLRLILMEAPTTQFNSTVELSMLNDFKVSSLDYLKTLIRKDQFIQVSCEGTAVTHL